MLEKPQEVVKKLLKVKHPHSNCIILAGSVVRGEATAYSDLDLIVLYEKIDAAYRESFMFDEWRIETFVHDLSTLRYFCVNLDKKEGKPSLPQMVIEGIAIPSSTELANKAKSFAEELLKSGPAPLSDEELRLRRYFITDRIDDIRAPRSKGELIATGTQLYSAISDFYFRSRGLWSADGKTIPRKLKDQNPQFHDEFTEAFRALFENGDQSKVIKLAEEVLGPTGGFLFDGLKLEAPKDWRIDSDFLKT